MKKTFGLIGAAGYVAPRHMAAIVNNGCDLKVICDVNDSVGVIDRYAPGCLYFRSHIDFFNYVQQEKIDYVSICTPNFLHVSNAISAMQAGADVIVEKPMCLTEAGIAMLKRVSKEEEKKVNIILQLRLHPQIVNLKARIVMGYRPETVIIHYQAPRGDWYYKSWKGNPDKSGGILFNIGVHLFDLVAWLFGPAKYTSLTREEPSYAEGQIRTEKGTDVLWALSTDLGAARRVFDVDGESIDLSTHLTNAHDLSYQKILSGKGFGVDDGALSVRMIEEIKR